MSGAMAIFLMVAVGFITAAIGVKRLIAAVVAYLVVYFSALGMMGAEDVMVEPRSRKVRPKKRTPLRYQVPAVFLGLLAALFLPLMIPIVIAVLLGLAVTQVGDKRKEERRKVARR